jgi:hypothetical protein
MAKEQVDYRAYLLRLWRVTEKDGPVWRASLERPGTHRRHCFANLEALFEFLRTETTAPREIDGNTKEIGE